MEVSPVQLLIFQPTPFCNLNCTYCYLPDRKDKRVMDVEIVRTSVQRLKDEDLLAPGLGIIWHAGEPTVVRREQYAEYFRAIRDILGDFDLVNHFQTNGTLIDDRWCEFIKEHEIAVGVSLDGPESIHDRSRKSWSGRGTLDKTLRGIETLKKHGIEFHTISVIGEASLGHAKEIYEFLVSLGPVLIGFNVEEQEGVNQTSTLTDRSDRVEGFFQELYDLARENGFDPPIREFENACGSIASCSAPDTNQQICPYRILTISVDGEFTTFSPELLGMSAKPYGGLAIGNVKTDSFRGALEGAKYQQMYADVSAGVKRCQETCEYYEVCGGGAPANKLFEKGSFAVAETRFCQQSLQIPTRIVLKDLETVLAGTGKPIKGFNPSEKGRWISPWQ
jgi:uncharacterized protein